MHITDWNIEEMTGYKPISTFYTDFSIADKFGLDAIKETFNRVFKEWKDDVKMGTELAMVMSWKSFEHQNNSRFCHLYSQLYYKMDNYCCKNYKGEDLKYYLRTTDQDYKLQLNCSIIGIGRSDLMKKSSNHLSILAILLGGAIGIFEGVLEGGKSGGKSHQNGG